MCTIQLLHPTLSLLRPIFEKARLTNDTAGIPIPSSCPDRCNTAPDRYPRPLRRARLLALLAYSPLRRSHRASQYTALGIRTRCRRRDLEADRRAASAN